MYYFLAKQDIIKHNNLFLYIRFGKEILIFGDIEIEKKFTALKVLPL